MMKFAFVLCVVSLCTFGCTTEIPTTSQKQAISPCPGFLTVTPLTGTHLCEAKDANGQVMQSFTDPVGPFSAIGACKVTCDIKPAWCSSQVFPSGKVGCFLVGGGFGCDINGECKSPDCTTDAICGDANACNGVEKCVNGTCQSGTSVACPGGTTCVPASGQCQATPLPPQCDTDEICSDGDFCNGVERCVEHKCVAGNPVSCTSGFACLPSSGNCQQIPTPPQCDEDGICDDGNKCNGMERCVSHTCQPGTMVVCTSGFACQPSSGSCVAIPPAPACDSDARCNDGNKCNGVEKCVSGTCQSGTSVNCNTGTACNPSTGICDPIPVISCISNENCSDGNACNGAETCDMVTHTCKLGTALTCAAGTTCNPTNGHCDTLPTPPACNDDARCSDNNACNGAEKCIAGVCQMGVVPQACPAGTACVPATGACQSIPAAPACNDSAICSDGNACNGTEQCVAGVCQLGTTPAACAAGTACVPATGACQPIPAAPACNDDARCSDGNACNGTETCNLATHTCAAGTPVVCAVGTACAPATGACVAIPASPACNDNARCSDGNACNGTEQCVAGVCQLGIPVVCAANTACVPATGLCQPLPTPPACITDANCDDANACNGLERCVSGVCQPGTAVSCAVGFNCVPATGACQAAPLPPQCTSDANCADGNVCNGTETCDLATHTCKAGTPVVCAANTACVPATGACQAIPPAPQCNDNARCSDGNACNGAETCSPTTLTCLAGTPVTCGTGTACNPSTGVCDAIPQSTCTSDGNCTDGNACNGTETCNLTTHTCVAGTPVNCVAGNVCNPTTGACNAIPQVSCISDLNCTDGNACNGAETCNPNTHVCVAGTAVVCASGTACAPATGACVAIPAPPQCDADPICSDGNACNGTETCNLTSHTCQPGTAVVCAAGFACAPATGACVAIAPTQQCASDANCADGNACNGAETCNLTTHTCQNGTAVTCPVGTVCTPATGACVVSSCASGFTMNSVGPTTCDWYDGTPAPNTVKLGTFVVIAATVGTVECAPVGARSVECGGVAPTSCTTSLGTVAGGNLSGGGRGCTVDNLQTCTVDADCNDGNPCTNDVCNVFTHKCEHGVAIICTAPQACSPADGACH